MGLQPLSKKASFETVWSETKYEGRKLFLIKAEGPSATIGRPGEAIGRIGTDRFQIEEIATRHNIPVFAIVIKQSVKEAINLMTKEIADRAEEVRTQIYEMINDNTSTGHTVLVVGVGNTLGVSQ